MANEFEALISYFCNVLGTLLHCQHSLQFKLIFLLLFLFTGEFRKGKVYKQIKAEASYLEWDCFRYIPDYDMRKASLTEHGQWLVREYYFKFSIFTLHRTRVNSVENVLGCNTPYFVFYPQDILW